MMINGLVGIREQGSLRWGWDLMMVAFWGVSESGGQGRSSLVTRSTRTKATVVLGT